jgi:hypothetical protein
MESLKGKPELMKPESVFFLSAVLGVVLMVKAVKK